MEAIVNAIGEDWSLAIVGLLGGLILGFAARMGRFCTLGALEDFHYGGSTLRLRMWGLALGTAIVAVFAAAAAGWVDPAQSRYMLAAPPLTAAIAGGLIFGLGMALSGNCGFGALTRLGGGEMRAFVVVGVLGITAAATSTGVLAPLRLALFPDAARPGISIAEHAASLLGMPMAGAGIVIGLIFCLVATAGPRETRVLWGLPVGIAIASGLIGSAWIAATGFAPVTIESHSFSAPIGETFLWTMAASAIGPGFGTGSVVGVISGAVIGSLQRRVFRWEACDDHRELHRQIFGAVLMGFGAVTAYGCSIGQGLSAFSTLCLTGPVTLGAIWLGGWLGLRYLIEGRLVAEH